ncbi:MAG: twin-arginine translocase TatA/TatE family subunit [Xanthomonadales bacterium]|nr:twin-arginine translocase TatA/TatE family subunit [Xanthomonadales bacterium]
MGITGISIWQLLIILLIVVLLFGTKRLRDVGGDLGAFIRSFRRGLREEEAGGGGRRRGRARRPRAADGNEGAADRR